MGKSPWDSLQFRLGRFLANSATEADCVGATTESPIHCPIQSKVHQPAAVKATKLPIVPNVGGERCAVSLYQYLTVGGCAFWTEPPGREQEDGDDGRL